MHMGNIRTFVLNAVLARQHGWRVLMRIEDLDGPRVKPEAANALLEELAWLGLTWEGDVMVQSDRAARYAGALDALIDAGLAYPCICSRKDIERAASAPHADDIDGTYPGICRGRFDSAEHAGQPSAWRLKVTDESLAFTDGIHGEIAFVLRWTGGDFVIFKKTGDAAYQLAVTLDDADSNVDAIVRGDDLLDSTARQMYLRRVLSLGPEPMYWHLPLVVGTDRKRLAKRHGDTRLEFYRDSGTTRERILGWVGAVSGLWEGKLREADMDDLVASFDPASVPKTPIVFTPEHDRFLRG
jgi:glutamyl-tRNA synthetase